MTKPPSDAPQLSVTGLLWRRCAAFFYDIVVLIGLLMVATFPYLGLFYRVTGTEAVPAGDFWFRLYTFAIVFGYAAVSWRYGGQTIGMKAWRIQAISLSGQPLTFRQIALRFVLGIPSLLLAGSGYWWAYLSPSHLTLPEQWSDTRTRHLPKKKTRL